uniref:Uncharacterized protein n=1 Tax=Cacopsylla melanoneura TaxID=428564 RepID=A0A8D8WL31_9HEMI
MSDVIISGTQNDVKQSIGSEEGSVASWPCSVYLCGVVKIGFGSQYLLLGECTVARSFLQKKFPRMVISWNKKIGNTGCRDVDIYNNLIICRHFDIGFYPKRE